MSDAKTNVVDEPYDEEEYDDDYRGPGRTIAIAAVVAIALGVGGYFAGHASAGGPSTLAEAVQQAQDGKLACGSTGTGSSASATPAAGGGAAGAPGAAGGAAPNGDFLVRAICDRSGQGGGFQPGAGQGRVGGGLLGPGGVTGQVQSVSGSTLTLTSQQRGTIKLKLSPSVKVTTTSSGSLSDVKKGATVSVSGTGQNNATPATGIFVLPASQ